MQDGEDEGFVVRLRGLPWASTPGDVVKFFGDAEIVGGEGGVHFTFSREGRPSGEAFVELATEDDLQMAVKKHNEHIGQRYIEVFRSKKSEMDWVVKRSGSNQPSNMGEAVVRLRGLPFGCSKEEIAQFFTGLEIVPNGIMLPEDRQGRSTGEAYVQFASTDIAEKALGKHKERIGHRYIEIFKSSMSEAYSAVGSPRTRPMMGSIGRPGPYDRNDRFAGMNMGMGMGMGMNNMSGGGGMPMGGYGRGRGGRGNVKGYFEDEFDDYGGGYGGGMGFGMGGRRGGSLSLRGMARGGRMTQNDLMRQRGATPGSHYISNTGHSVHMRGLPFQALESDILDFFAPLQPVKVEFEFSDTGRATGEANVDFASHQEAVEAMKKHKTNMQHRYIELFLNSTPETRSGSGFSGPMGGGGFGNDTMGGSMGGFGTGAGSYNGSSSYDEAAPQNIHSFMTSPMGRPQTQQYSTVGSQGTQGFGSWYSSVNQNSRNMNSYMGGGGGFGGSGLGMSGGGGNLMGNPNYTAF